MSKNIRFFLGIVALAIVMILAQQYASQILGQDSSIQTGVPSALKMEAITILNNCLPSGNVNLDKEISAAADRIKASLDRRFWENDFSLNCELGSEVFDRERQSIQKITDEMRKKYIPQAVALDLVKAMTNLMDADRILVQTLISEARKVSAPMTEEIRQAEEELSRAERERANNRFDNAVEHYKYAWIHACAARGPETNLPLNVILDSGGTTGVATVTPDQEATIEALSGAGIRYMLTVPKGAVLNLDGETITMTPIFDIENFPLSGGFLAGVHLEPEGLLFFKPVVLTIVLPATIPTTGLMGFSHQQSTGGFGLTAVQSQGSILTLGLLHFTDEGIGLGSSTDCSGLLDITLTPEARDKTIINCIISSSGGLDNVSPSGEQIIIEAMRDWFNLGVMPQLSAALSDDSLIESGINGFLSWDKATQLLGSIGDMLQQQVDNGKDLVNQVVANSIARNENDCVGSKVRTEKIDLVTKLVKLQKMVDILGLSDLQEVRDAICGGAFNEADAISVTPESASLIVTESTPLTAHVTNFAGEFIDADLTWDNSNPTAVGLAAAGSTGSVSGLAVGSAVITAIADNPFIPDTDLRDSSQITVDTAASVEVQPIAANISIGGSLTLSVIVKDSLGQELTGLPIDWTIPAGGFVSFDPVSQVATGMAPGFATLTATCAGKSGSSTITVAEIDSVEVQPATKRILIDGTVTLTVIVKDTLGNIITGLPIEWTIPAGGAISFDPISQIVTGKAEGSETLTATCGGKTGSSTITVVDLTYITVTPNTSSLFPDDDVQLTATGYDISGNPFALAGSAVSWTSSNNDVATVDFVGLVHGVIRGMSRITASYRSRTADAVIRVDRSIWRITWRAVISDQNDCTIPVVNPYDPLTLSASTRAIETVEGLWQGDATILTVGLPGSEESAMYGDVISANSDQSLRDYKVYQMTMDCPSGGSISGRSTTLWAYQSVDGGEALKDGFWLSVLGDPARGTLSARCGLVAPPVWHITEQTNDGGVGCYGEVTEPSTIHYEGPGSRNEFLYHDPFIYPVGASVNSFYGTWQTMTVLQVGLNSPEHGCPNRSVFANWEIRIERIR